MESDKKKKQLKIEIDENVGQGEYVNFAIVTHSAAEFVMDFIRILPGLTKSKVKSRVVISPMHAKTFLAALKDNIEKYEILEPIKFNSKVKANKHEDEI